MVEELISWFSNAPQLSGEILNWSYLPSFAGWSLTVPKSETRIDILGNSRTILHLKITRRYTVQSNADRIAVLASLEDLAAWAKENPPEHTHLKVTGLPEFTSRNNSGIEDISVTMTVERSEN